VVLWGRHEIRVKRTIQAAAQPVLHLAHSTWRGTWLLRHQRPVDRFDVPNADRRRIVGASDRLLHRADIGGDRARTPAGRAWIDECPGKVERADLVALDPGGGDRFGPEQQGPDRLETACAGTRVELPDRPLGVGRRTGGLEWHGRLQRGDRVRNECAVRE